MVRRGNSVTVQGDHHSDHEPGQLVLFGAAAIVLLVVVWTFVQPVLD
jgi:hypothetical protein